MNLTKASNRRLFFSKLRRKISRYPLLGGLATLGQSECAVTSVKPDSRWDINFVPVVPKYQLDAPPCDRFYQRCLPSYRPAKTPEVVGARGVYLFDEASLFTDSLQDVLVLDREGQILDQVSFMFEKGLSGATNDRHVMSRPGPPTQLSGKAFSLMVGGGGSNYFHWMLDVLPRLHLLRECGLMDEVDHFLVSTFDRPFQESTLACLGVPREKVKSGMDFPHVLPEQLLVPTPVRAPAMIPSWSLDFLYDAFVDSKPEASEKKFTASKRLYLTRRDAGKRRVSNEAEVIDLLEHYGFETLTLTELPFEDQVAVFNAAECIVCAHGASLANLVFCRVGCSVIELFTEGYVLPMYCEIACRKGLDYHYLIEADQHRTQMLADRSIEHAQAMDVRVDLTKLEQSLSDCGIA